ncbi:MAG TPA: sigma-70 family RNA polymerase sigma factor [Gemmataceae bacterium]|jgi:RNA polymerase sigma-70 factor (ECF subfamily)|nr:sigma-70 family RNA polymerase sigma factor [Gemmataceae bacterium]
MGWQDISELVERAQTGDREAYGSLVEQFQPTVYAVGLARLRNPTEANELVQEVFIHAMLKLPQLRDAQCFPGWLRQITERMAINRLTRRGWNGSADPAMLEQVPAQQEGPLDDLLRSEQKAKVWQGLERLSDLDRETLVSFYIHGRSLAQMSREFEAPVGTIKRRLHVARHRLRDHLEDKTNPAGPARRKVSQRVREKELVCA